MLWYPLVKAYTTIYIGVVTNAQSLSMMSAPNLMSMDGTEYDTFQASDSKGSNRKYPVETEDMMDYFLFAGQSNSIGHTTSDQSIGYDEILCVCLALQKLLALQVCGRKIYMTQSTKFMTILIQHMFQQIFQHIYLPPAFQT